MTNYLNQYIDKNLIPQTEPLDEAQIKNAAGGYVYDVGAWNQLKRFLILGSESGTYYVSEKDHTKKNIECLKKCVKEDPKRVVDLIVEVSDQGRAPKNDYAIFALAQVSVDKNTKTRVLAYDALPKVCRIGTHLYQFCDFRKALGGGWGTGMKKAVGNWFVKKNANNLALQVAKYKQRDGWAARDLLRLSHPKPVDSYQESIFKWVVKDNSYHLGIELFVIYILPTDFLKRRYSPVL